MRPAGLESAGLAGSGQTPGMALSSGIGDWMVPPAGWRVQNTEEISAGLCPQFPLQTYLIPCNFLGDKSVICPNDVSLGGLLSGSWSPE